MDELRAMEKFDAFHDLINDESIMYVLKNFLSGLVEIYPMALCRSASINSNTR